MKVKICGVTHPDDAAHAACSGADFIGIIFAERSRRKVDGRLANEIAVAAKANGAVPVGVFAEQTAQEIVEICKEIKITVAQVHRLLSEEEFLFLSGCVKIVPALSVGADGMLLSPLLSFHRGPLLFDCLKGGTGVPFDWRSFTPPKDIPWMLAGGLHPDNVEEAISLLKPHGVDVASGVELPKSTRKDPHLVEEFIIKAKKE